MAKLVLKSFTKNFFLEYLFKLIHKYEISPYYNSCPYFQPTINVFRIFYDSLYIHSISIR